ncbi:MAG: HprK-related kinase A [Rubrivivax sp.]|nr:HprK-related kinase A [Rubrivivax sp.]
MINAVLHIPPFRVRLRSPLAEVWRHVDLFYPGADSDAVDIFVDFDVEISHGDGIRRLWRRQARFLLDGAEPFFPLPAEQAAPMFEWGLNWCVAQRPLGYLVLHAAVVERDGAALMLPGFPGAGKSTLCAALTLIDRWRLFSDELAILDPADGLLLPHPRPICVKNDSIDLVAAFPGSCVGPVYQDTRKGTIAHLACAPQARERAAERARVAWIVFPRFVAGGPLQVERISRVEAFAWISEQSFNKERMGEAGFKGLCDVLDTAECFELSYGSTADALEGIERICSP